MGLLDGLLGGGGPLDVGSVKATLGYDHDRTGLTAWDRAVDNARRDARIPVEQELQADFDRTGFVQYSRATAHARTESDRLQKAADRTGRGLATVARAGLYASGAVGAGFAVGAWKATEASSDLNESLNAANAIFEGQGQRIEKWSRKSADGFGLARSEALQAASSIGAMLKPMGFATDEAAVMSERMVELAGDMASFNNEDPSEMLERIRSGLAGESEPLRRFGVDLRVTAVEAFALKRGLIEQGEALEGAAFAQAAYQKILADTRDQQGDFGRTSDGLANVQRRLRANTIDLAASFGDALAPKVEGAAGNLNDFILQMKEGRGAGGDFRDRLEEIGRDVEGFADELAAIIEDPNLQPSDKFGQIFGRLIEVGAAGIQEAIPPLAEAAAEAAPEVVGAFVSAFIGADSWGRIAIGAWLIAKLGGWGAIRGIGSRIGGTVAADAAAGAAGGLAAGGAGGLGGRLRGTLGRVGPVARSLGGLGLGLAIGDSILSEIDRRIREGSDDLGEALEAKTGDRFGFIPADAMSFEADTERARRLLDIYQTMSETRLRMDDVSRRENEAILRIAREEGELTEEQAEAAGRMFQLLRRGQELGVGVDLGMDPEKLREIGEGFEALRSGALASLEDIQRVSKRGHETIAEEFGEGTAEARKLTAENMRATAQAIAQGVQRGEIEAGAGMKRIKRLIRDADLLEGLEPRKFGRDFADAFGRARDVSRQGLDRLVDDFQKLPKGARQAAYEAMRDQLQELRRGGKLNEREVRQINSRLLSEFTNLKEGGVETFFKLAKGTAANMGAMGNAVGLGLEVIRDNVNEGLNAFEVNPVKYAIKKLGKLLGGGERKARGGFLKGPSRDDVIPVLAGGDEAFLTSWQQQPVEYALQMTAARGEQPYPSLAALFRGETGTHSSGPARRARGGFAGKSFNVDGAKPGFVPFMNYLNSMYGPIYVMSGLRPGSITTSGNVSNHASGNAVDVSTQSIAEVTGPAALAAAPSADVRRMDAMVDFARAHINLPGDDLWRTFTGGNHYNHWHRGITSREAESAEAMLAYISRLPKGGSFGSIPRIVLDGPAGPLLDFAQANVDDVRKAANRWKAKQANFGGGRAVSPAHSFGGGPFSLDELAELWSSTGRNGDPRLMAAIAMGESRGDPRADNGIARGLWQIIASTWAAYGEGPWDNAFDPTMNAEAAHAILAGGGLSQWDVYNFGLHSQFMSRGGFLRDIRRTESRLEEVRDKLRREPPTKDEKKRIEEIQELLERKSLSRDRREGLRAELEDLKGGKQISDKRRKELEERESDLAKKLERLRRRQRKYEKKQSKKIRARGLHPEVAKLAGNKADEIGDLEEEIEIAETNATGEWSEAGSDYSSGELEGLTNEADAGLYDRLLAKLRRYQELLQKAIEHFQRRMKVVEKEIERISKLPKKQREKQAWKLAPLRANRDALRDALASARTELEDVQGRTGVGGKIFSTETRIRELGMEPSGGAEGGDDELLEQQNAALAELLEGYRRRDRVVAAQAPVFGSDLAGFLARGGLGYATPLMAEPILGSYRTGTRFVPHDGLYELHRGETVDQGGPSSIDGRGYWLVDADAAALGVRVREITAEEYARRSERAGNASLRPAAGQIARRLS